MSYKNKIDQALASKKHYEANKQKIKDRAKVFTKKTREVLKEYIQKYLKDHCCIDCGFCDTRALDFDHLKDKSFNIADAVNKGYSLERVKEEILKCEIRCANCHRIITYERRNNNAG